MKIVPRFSAFFLCMLVFILAGALSACGPSQEELNAASTQIVLAYIGTQTAQAPTVTPIPSRIPTSTPTPTPSLPSPEEILEAAGNALEAAGTFHFEMDIWISASAEGIDLEFPINTVGDYQSPDRSHSMMTVSIMGSSMETEQIVIGEKVYQTNPISGEWMIAVLATFPVRPHFSRVNPCSGYYIHLPGFLG
jgi:hypothetical protein